jgi:hypothetical protein
LLPELRDKADAKGFVDFVFCFLIFISIVFGYDIGPYAGESSSEGKSLNLVFCSLDYPNDGDFLKDIETLIQRLKMTKPFDEFNNLKVWYIALSKQEESEIFKPTQGLPPLEVCLNFINSISANLNSNYKLVIIDSLGSVSCAELALPDRISLIILGKNRYRDKDSFTKGFLHELGHSLGLHDESPNSEAALCLPGPPNCAPTKEEAQRLWGDLTARGERVGYFSGCCGDKNYFRPTIASLMNNPDEASDFGPANERYIRDALRYKKFVNL